jgi:dsRNA-specific ribonuclease
MSTFNVPVEICNDKIQIMGTRGKPFIEFISSLLEKSNLKSNYIDYLTNETSIKVYERAFTHISIDPENNYEYLEILGDVTCNKSIVWYIKERFPELQNSQGVKVIARLRINLVSKKNFSLIAEQLGFIDFISYEKEIKESNEKSILEDVFEAFFGATELLIDQFLGIGTGYSVCYRLLKYLLDQITISLKYEDLYDSITRLKETFDYYKQQLPGRQCPFIWGNMAWENTKLENKQVVYLYQVEKKLNKKKLLATAEAPLLDEAKQLAANIFLQELNKKGYQRPIPEYYLKLVQSQTVIS